MARFVKLGSMPPGLYHDEALNGIDAWRVLQGERPIFFTANNGREPLFVYGIAMAMSLLGRTPVAVRLPAAILGTLLVPATFMMARALFGEWVGLWSAWLIAVAPWPVNLSRIGLRAISMPLVLSVAVWLWWTGTQTASKHRRVWWALGGLFLGASLYTYTAARFVVVVAVLYGFYVLEQWWVGRERPRRRRSQFGATLLAMTRSEVVKSLLIPALSAILAATPLLVYGLANWETFVARPGQVSILTINRGDVWGALLRNVAGAAGLFVYRGDFIPRHNVPLRPLFDPLVSIWFVLGVFLCLKRLRDGDRASALTLIWCGVMLMPTILAEDCPHFLRAVGVLPVAVLFPALGLEWTRKRLLDFRLAWVGNLLTGGALLISALWGGYDYFVRHGGNPALAHDFEAAQVQEAVEINRFLGTGWLGQGWAEPPGELSPGRRVYLHPRMWEDRPTTHFLVGSPERISILGRDPVVQATQVLALVWPFEEMRDVQQVFPHPAEISSWPGPMERGDLETEARLLYVAFRANRLPDGARERDIVARFEQGIELLARDVAQQDDGLAMVTLRWRARRPLETDYTIFVHVVRGGQTVAQDDHFPASGYFPTTWWRPGDEVLDVHLVSFDPAQDQIVVGWYEWRSMQHLAVLDERMQPVGTSLVLQ